MEGQTLGEESELKYVFKKEGIYNVSVRVTDNAGNVAAALQKLQVEGKSLRYALQNFDPAKVWIMGHRILPIPIFRKTLLPVLKVVSR